MHSPGRGKPISGDTGPDTGGGGAGKDGTESYYGEDDHLRTTKGHREIARPSWRGRTYLARCAAAVAFSPA